MLIVLIVAYRGRSISVESLRASLTVEERLSRHDRVVLGGKCARINLGVVNPLPFRRIAIAVRATIGSACSCDEHIEAAHGVVQSHARKREDEGEHKQSSLTESDDANALGGKYVYSRGISNARLIERPLNASAWHTIGKAGIGHCLHT